MFDNVDNMLPSLVENLVSFHCLGFLFKQELMSATKQPKECPTTLH